LVKEIVIRVEQTPDGYIASVPDTGRCCVGYTPEEATADLWEVLRELQALLQEDEERLSPALQHELEALNRFFGEKEAQHT